MSAGICIMNKNAIALAADSAVTVGNHAAIHNSANKLFALSRYEPVGAVIYANADFMRVPMEIIIKEYKRSLGSKAFEDLKEYVFDFINFLETNIDLFRFSLNEENYVNQVFIDILIGLRNGYNHFVENKLNDVERPLKEEELAQIATDAFEQTISFIRSRKPLPNSDFAKYIKENYYSKISGYISAHFTWLSQEQHEMLASEICDLYDKNFFRNGYLGIVIAGYGRNDIFPKMCHMHLGGIIGGKLRYIVRDDLAITENNMAEIMPFAQTDVMQTFLFGINDNFFQEMSTEIPKQINKKICSLDDALFAEGKKDEIQQELDGTTSEIIRQIVSNAHKNYMQPIKRSVATLPIEEMALLAESMINITSIRRKVALDQNIGTVGGPVDVAIISKGDGLVWLKRKHYFDLSHNLQYAFTRYSNTGSNSCKGENDE